MTKGKDMPNDAVTEAIKKDIDEILAAKKAANLQFFDGEAGLSGKQEIAEQFHESLVQAAARVQVDISRIPVSSQRPLIGPFLTLFKRLVRKSTSWLYQPLFTQISSFNAGIIDILNKMTLQLMQIEHKEANLRKEVQNLSDLEQRLESYRAEAAFLQSKLSLALQHQKTSREKKTVAASVEPEESLEDIFTGTGWSYRSFERKFRGTEALIKERQHIYLKDIQVAFNKCGGYALDIGAGRGEFLELCREAGIPAKGVDLDKEMVELCQKKGLSVEYADGLAYLEALPDESLCALTAFQLVEHLTPEQLWHLTQNAVVKLKPGGLVLLETLNPESFYSLIKYFYLDLTHVKPIPSATLKFLLEAAGLKQVEVQFSSPVPKEVQLDGTDANINKLNELLFGYQDYAVLGWR